MAGRSKIERTHFNYYLDVMRKLEWDLHQTLIDAKHIPAEWDRIAQERGASPKVKVTLRVEQDVLKFFRVMGQGYQTRMNDVLRSWMHARLGGLLKGPDGAETQKYINMEFEGRPKVGDAALDYTQYIRRPDGTLEDMEAVAALADRGLKEAGSVRELLEIKRDAELAFAARTEQEAQSDLETAERARAAAAEVQREIDALEA